MSLLAVLSLAILLYIGTFAFWWVTSPSATRTVGGKEVHIVEVRQSDLMWRTQAIWEPAFWFLKSVCGYRYEGYIAAEEDSRFIYVK